MATIVESSVRVAVTLTRDGDGDHAIVRAVSLDAEGREWRRLDGRDIYPMLSAARQSGITALLDDAIARVKTEWEIP